MSKEKVEKGKGRKKNWGLKLYRNFKNVIKIFLLLKTSL